jgi:TPP-dependent pyruvate/acetoin dehydrogenase alpha subunit
MADQESRSLEEDEIPAGLTGDDLVEMYRLMLLGRRFTEQALEWYAQGRVPQGLHPSIGQEAVGVGACYGLQPGDWVLPSLRTSEAFWTRGVTVLDQLNAMMGNVDSISGGKETSHHAGYPDQGILAVTGIVGSAVPVATGAAMALRMQGKDGVVVCFFGDGAANRGDFHEGMNLAAIFKAPVVFVCENNLYAQKVPAAAAMAITDIADRASGYGMPGRVVDGQDVLAVYGETQAAVERARSGDGPTLLECKTYRFKTHYPIFEEERPAEEIEKWVKRDPIAILGDRLIAQGRLEYSTIETMERAIGEELAQAIGRAEVTPQPDPRNVFTEIYAESWETREQ